MDWYHLHHDAIGEMTHQEVDDSSGWSAALLDKFFDNCQSHGEKYEFYWYGPGAHYSHVKCCPCYG